MSGAERLREAVTAIRDEWGERGDEGTAWHRTVAFHLAVADWLEAEARDRVGGLHEGGIPPAALAVADAYLGSPS